MAKALHSVWRSLRESTATEDDLVRALLLEKLRRDALRVDIRSAILEAFDVTADAAYCVRRTAVYAVVAKATGARILDETLTRRTTAIILDLGAVPSESSHRRLFTFLRRRGLDDREALREARACRSKRPMGKRPAKPRLDVAPQVGTKAFRDLQRYWYARTGLDDDDETLSRLPAYDAAVAEINQAELDKAKAFLWSNEWADDMQRQIWERYAVDGMSVRRIAEAVGSKKTAVHKIISQLRTLAGMGQTAPSRRQADGEGRKRGNRETD